MEGVYAVNEDRFSIVLDPLANFSKNFSVYLNDRNICIIEALNLFPKFRFEVRKGTLVTGTLLSGLKIDVWGRYT